LLTRMWPNIAWLACFVEFGPRPSGGMDDGPSPVALPTKAGGWVHFLCWGYVANLAGLCVLMRVGGDRWWPATLLMFGPRWVFWGPLCLLFPLGVKLRAPTLRPLCLASLLVIGPMMGYCLTWRGLLPASEGGRPPLRVLTCNVKYRTLAPHALAEVISGSNPDVVVLQGWSSQHDLPALLPGKGWYLSGWGELCVASRYPIGDATVVGSERMKGGGHFARYTLVTPEGPVSLFNVHLGSPREGLKAVREDLFDAPERLRESIALRQEESWIASQSAAAARDPILLAGDFNLPPESTVYRRDWSRYTDAFSAAGLGTGYTWFSRYHGLRIDHALAGSGWRCLGCWVGPDVGSDHRPLIADWVRVGSGI
jgi:vancomycin resistance protein VanJ